MLSVSYYDFPKEKTGYYETGDYSQKKENRTAESVFKPAVHAWNESCSLAKDYFRICIQN